MGEDPKTHVFLKTTKNLKLGNGLSWNDYFERLIEDRLFDTPTQAELKKGLDLQKYDKGYALLSGDGILKLNVKVGNNYRSVSYGNLRLPEEQRIAELEYLQSLVTILSQFKQ